jgi:hypothetical protein
MAAGRWETRITEGILLSRKMMNSQKSGDWVREQYKIDDFVKSPFARHRGQSRIMSGAGAGVHNSLN